MLSFLDWLNNWSTSVPCAHVLCLLCITARPHFDQKYVPHWHVFHRGNPERISSALADIGVETEKQDPELRTEMAYGMFDTRGKVDPFDPNSPIKQSAISRFPADMFFVLRVVQLLRGLANGMGINDFSSASQWAPLAKEACRGHQQHQQQQQQQQQLQSRPKKLASRFASMGSQEMQAATEGGRGWGVAGSLRNLITWPYRPN
uniref:Uncharacterized protein n=1 Tax=Dunaliella tertiolecta TaxID=3047 RepID=A0A7S3QWD3_DUNTE